MSVRIEVWVITDWAVKSGVIEAIKRQHSPVGGGEELLLALDKQRGRKEMF